jgi:hypothetical protein
MKTFRFWFVRSYTPQLLGLGLNVAVLLLPRPGGAVVRCLKDPGDAAQIRAVRAQIEAECICSTYDGSKGAAHLDYLKEAKAIIKDAIAHGALRTQCRATVTAYYKSSSCGYAPAVHAMPCIKTTNRGKVSCAVKTTMKKDGVTPTKNCVDGRTFTVAQCTAYTHCIDAADTNGDLVIAAPGDSGACGVKATPTATSPGGPTPTPTPTLPGPPPPTPTFTQTRTPTQTYTPSPTPATCPCFYAGELSAGVCPPPLVPNCEDDGPAPFPSCPNPLWRWTTAVDCDDYSVFPPDVFWVANVNAPCPQPVVYTCYSPGMGTIGISVAEYNACRAAILASGLWSACWPRAQWSNGTPCHESGNLCGSGNCVDGVCCESGSCPPGSTCAFPGEEGHCVT